VSKLLCEKALLAFLVPKYLAVRDFDTPFLSAQIYLSQITPFLGEKTLMLVFAITEELMIKHVQPMRLRNPLYIFTFDPKKIKQNYKFNLIKDKQLLLLN